MANKIQLGKRPANFKPCIVTFELPEGGEGQIEITFKYRTRTEFGKLLDEIFKDAGEKPAPDAPAKEFSLADIMEKTRDKNADYLVEAVKSWNLDDDVNLENLRELADTLPAAAVAIMEKYRFAATEGRLGN